VQSGGESGEFHLAVGVGSGFEIELVESAETVIDVDLYGRGVGGLVVSADNGKFDGAWTSDAVHDGNFL
jgi:hypothetical protein